MPVQLDVNYFRQETNYSCWWFSLRMLMAYHWGGFPAHPWEWQPEVFGRSIATGIVAYGDAEYRAAFERTPIDRSEFFTAHPSVWYEHGVVPDLDHVHQLANIAGLEAADVTCAGYSSRGTGRSTLTLEWMEALLRRAGPVLVIRERGGGHHAMVVSGVEYLRSDGTNPQLVVEDPWPSEVLPTGEATEGGPGRRITFPAFQAMLAPQLLAYNMLILRSAGRRHLCVRS